MRRRPATRCERAPSAQADVSWWHPWRGNQTESRVPQQALFTKIPHAPRYFAALAERDRAAAKPVTPLRVVLPVAPYGLVKRRVPAGTGAASSSSSGVTGTV